MAMLSRQRRFLALIVAALLVTPLALTVLFGGGAATSQEEKRDLAPLPTIPHRLQGWQKFPKAIEAYMRDHFSPRRSMVRAQAIIAHQWLRSGNDKVLMGSDGWMFYRGDDMIEQSSGLLMRSDRVAETADVVASVAAQLKARGIRFIFASAPNSATIYPEEVPRWARNPGVPTETDALLALLAARGIRTVDLRSPLLNAKAGERVYRKHDTHWSPDGSRIGFNAVVAALGHPEWQIAAKALGPPMLVRGGDLALMLGLGDESRELVRPLMLPSPQVAQLTPYVNVYSSARKTDPTILVLGDSFTVEFFPALVTANAHRLVWAHHLFCRFDWRWIDQFQPDEVWWLPTERAELCNLRARPNGLPATPVAG